MGTIVAGVDFGTLNVRVSIFDSERGTFWVRARPNTRSIASGGSESATQSHADHMSALAAATRKRTAAAGMNGAQSTPWRSILPVQALFRWRGMVPLDDYYLWCDHRAWREAAEITAKATSTA